VGLPAVVRTHKYGTSRFAESSNVHIAPLTQRSTVSDILGLEARARVGSTRPGEERLGAAVL